MSAFHSADCDTDHALVISKVKVMVRCKYKSKERAKSKIKTMTMKDQEKKGSFKTEFNACMKKLHDKSSVHETWNML